VWHCVCHCLQHHVQYLKGAVCVACVWHYVPPRVSLGRPLWTGEAAVTWRATASTPAFLENALLQTAPSANCTPCALSPLKSSPLAEHTHGRAHPWQTLTLAEHTRGRAHP